MSIEIYNQNSPYLTIFIEKRKIYVFCDETYSDPLIKADIKSIGSLSKYGIGTYGLSKKYGLSTLRCGIVVANEEIIDKVIKASYTSIAVNSGLLEKEWLKFFKKKIEAYLLFNYKVIFYIPRQYRNFYKAIDRFIISDLEILKA